VKIMNNTNRVLTKQPKPVTIDDLEKYQTDERECNCGDFKHRQHTCKHQRFLLSLLTAAIQYYRTTCNRCGCDDWTQMVNLNEKSQCCHQRACALSVEPENQKPVPLVVWERLAWLEVA